jgi:hypothetical protein
MSLRFEADRCERSLSGVADTVRWLGVEVNGERASTALVLGFRLLLLYPPKV